MNQTINLVRLSVCQFFRLTPVDKLLAALGIELATSAHYHYAKGSTYPTIIVVISAFFSLWMVSHMTVHHKICQPFILKKNCKVPPYTKVIQITDSKK